MQKLLEVRFPDGTEICRNKVTDTYIDCLEKIGLPLVNSLGISARKKSYVNLVSDTTDGYNYTEVGGWFVYRKMGIGDMAKNLAAVSERLNLNLQIGIVETDRSFREDNATLRVFLDGEEITRSSGAKTFAEAIRHIGEPEVERLGIIIAGHSLVSRVGGEGYTPPAGVTLSGPRQPPTRKSPDWKRLPVLWARTCGSLRND